MMDFSHISEFEEILDAQTRIKNNLEKALREFEDSKESYKRLIEYYYSDERYEDLEADDRGEIPSNLKRGVLSEDEIYNLLSDYHELTLKMLEISTFMLKI